MKRTICDLCGEVLPLEKSEKPKKRNLTVGRGRPRRRRRKKCTDGKVVHIHDFEDSGTYDDYYECDHKSVHVCPACAKTMKLSRKKLAEILKEALK